MVWFLENTLTRIYLHGSKLPCPSCSLIIEQGFCQFICSLKFEIEFFHFPSTFASMYIHLYCKGEIDFNHHEAVSQFSIANFNPVIFFFITNVLPTRIKPSLLRKLNVCSTNGPISTFVQIYYSIQIADASCVQDKLAHVCHTHIYICKRTV